MPNAVLQRLVSEREQTLDTIDAILANAEAEERDPSAAELDLVTRNRTRVAELEPQITELLEVEETRARSASQSALIQRAIGTPRGGDPPATRDDPTPEGPVYRTFAQYARDALICRVDRIGALVDPVVRQRAADRLARAAAVHTLTTDVPGLIPDQHIAQIFEQINKARPVVQS